MNELMPNRIQDIIGTDEGEVLERLIDSFKEVNNGDMKDTMLDINDILDLLHNDTESFIRSLEIMRDDLADVNNCCPVCGEELEFSPSYSDEEYQCQPVGVNVCPNNCEA